MKQIIAIIIFQAFLFGMLNGQTHERCIKKGLSLNSESDWPLSSNELAFLVQGSTIDFLNNLSRINAQSISYDSIYWEILKLTTQDFRCEVFYMDSKSDQMVSRTRLVDELRQYFQGHGFLAHSFCMEFEDPLYLHEFGIVRIPVQVEVHLPLILDGNTFNIVRNKQRIKLRFVYSYDGLDVKLLSILRVTNIRPAPEFSIGIGPLVVGFAQTIIHHRIIGEDSYKNALEAIYKRNLVNTANLSRSIASGLKIDLRVSIPLKDGKKYQIPIQGGISIINLEQNLCIPEQSTLALTSTENRLVLPPDSPTKDVILISKARESVQIRTYQIGIGLSRIWQFDQWKISVNPSVNLTGFKGRKHELTITGDRVGIFQGEDNQFGFFGGNLGVGGTVFNTYGASNSTHSVVERINWLFSLVSLAGELSYKPIKSKLGYFTRIEAGYMRAIVNKREFDSGTDLVRLENFGLINNNDLLPFALQGSLILGINFKLN